MTEPADKVAGADTRARDGMGNGNLSGANSGSSLTPAHPAESPAGHAAHAPFAVPLSGLPSGPVLREVKMHLVTPSHPVIGTVISSERCTTNSKSAALVRHVAIDISGTPLAGNFVAGQSFGVLPPGIEAAGKPHRLRLYSIASPSRGEDGEGNVLATAVKRTIDEDHNTHKLFLGVCSNYLCDLQIGDKVAITGPSGKRFVLPAQPDDHDYIFIATGTGIAPFRGMIIELLARQSTSSITLIMGSPYTSDLLYHRQLTQLSAAHPRFTYLTAISREHGASGERPMYVHHRLAHHPDRFIPLLRSPRTLVYVCGIAGMELGVLTTIATLLPRMEAEQYVRCVGDGPSFEDVSKWERTMIPRHITPTKRIFLEVY